MNTADAPSLTERVDRFLRWFFTASPDAELVPLPLPQTRSRTVAQRAPTPLRPQHSGPVRVAAKGKQ